MDRPLRKGSGSAGLHEKLQLKMDTAAQTLLPKKSLSYCFGDNRTLGSSIVVNGASKRAVSNFRYLRKVVKVSPINIELAKSITVTVTHTGLARINTGSSKIIMQTVYLITCLKLSLMSTSRLDEH